MKKSKKIPMQTLNDTLFIVLCNMCEWHHCHSEPDVCLAAGNEHLDMRHGGMSTVSISMYATLAEVPLEIERREAYVYSKEVKG